MSDIDTAIQTFVEEITKNNHEYYELHYKNLDKPTFVVERGSKFAKVIRDGSSAMAFIATKDFSNKALGKVNIGDVFKPATYAAPAKHARGNILADDGGLSALSPDKCSIRYL